MSSVFKPAFCAPGDVLARAEAQETLFSEKLNWSDLARVDLPEGVKCRIAVLRNHTFEPVAALVKTFARFGGWEPDFRLSDYDDTLSFGGYEEAGLILLWLDASVYKIETRELADYLASWARGVRQSTAVPVIAAIWTDGQSKSADMIKEAVEAVPGVRFADVRAAITDALGRCVEDSRMRAVGGTPLGREQQAVVARELGCRWMPAALLPPVKAMALDLDGTLHEGVLGESGTNGVFLSAAHEKLQKKLKALKDKGVFLSLVSRNEEKDVVELFEKRGDYPLRWDDFSAAQIGWESKAEGVSRIAEKLRIGVDSVLIVDDNPGELAAVNSLLPEVKTLWAPPDILNCDRALDRYPGLWRWDSTREDFLRAGDLSKEGDRAVIWERSHSEDDYFRALNVRLTYAVNPASHIKRLAELSRKTNQFNLSLSRMGEAEVSGILNSPESDAVSVDLSDRLSESGVIAFTAAFLDGEETLVVKEVCVSCRALGRRVEDAVVLRAIMKMPNYLNCRRVAFRFSRGPRNAPALGWLEKLAGRPLSGDEGAVRFDRSDIDRRKFSAEIDFHDS